MPISNKKRWVQALAKSNVIAEDISQITTCPKCQGVLKWGQDTRYEDAVSCVYCGWRPSAKVEIKNIDHKKIP